VLIGLLITHLTAAGRTESKIAANMISNAEAAAAADGAIAEAIFYLTHTDERLRWAADGNVHAVKIGTSSVSLRLSDESGRINPNLASDAVMAALLREIGVEPSRAERLAAAIGGWHDVVRQSRPGGGGASDYQAAGLDYGPPGTPIEDIEELGRIVGMSPDILAALRPHLSLWNPAEFPNTAVSDRIVARVVDQVAQTTGTILQRPAPSTRLTLGIVATAKAPSGASVTRHAVVRVGPGLEKGYQVVVWDTAAVD
jgi:general secretion pathway protein K